MLGFANKAYSDPNEKPTVLISETTAFVLLFVSLFLCIHGIYAFTWRSSKFAKNPSRSRRYTSTEDWRFDDSGGTLMLMLVITLSFASLFWINVADLLEILSSDDDN